VIGIDTYDENEISKFLPQLGIGRHKVAFNPRTLDNISVYVQIGGHDVRTNHCYVQHEGRVPVIQVLDPKTCYAEPINRFWIKCGLSKALYIDKHGDIETKINTTIRPNFEQVLSHFTLALGHPVSVDLEIDMSTHEIIVVGFAYKIGDEVHAISIPFLNEGENYWTEAQEIEIWRFLAALLSDVGTTKIFQNFIFDTMYLARYGFTIRGKIYDTMIVNHWIDPELPKSLADLGRLYLTCDVWKGRDNWSSNESLWLYNAKDAGYTLLILERQIERLTKENRINFLEKQLVPLANEVLAICSRCWRLDAPNLASFRASLEAEAMVLRETLKTFASDLVRPKVTYIQRKGKPKPGIGYFRKLPDSEGYERQALPEGLKQLKLLPFPLYEQKVEERPFNPLSPLHIKEVLRAVGVTIPLTKGAESSNENTLLKLLERKSVPQEIKDNFLSPLLEYRGLMKLISTYYDVALDQDGLCRFSINIAGTVTSRFSSKQTPWETGFNAQNIPKSFRKVVLPHNQDNVIINLDFKQADPHMVAWLSGEEQMLAILNDPKGDLHAHTASKIFGYDITKQEGYKDSFERKLGKACNNGLNYGMQVFKFIETCRKQGLTLDYDTATKAYDAYFKAYPLIRIWQETIRNQIIQTRTLTTPHGRRRFFYGHMNDKLINDALAYIPPTTVSDALNDLWLRFANYRTSAIIIGQCHDSLTFECPVTKVDETCLLLHNVAKTVTFKVKERICNFPIDLEVGPSWGQLTKWKIS